MSNLVYGVSSGVPVWLIFIPNAVFENDAFDNFADKIEPLDPAFPEHYTKESYKPLKVLVFLRIDI